jgi:uncharacterized RDD family membrane protein YckC
MPMSQLELPWGPGADVFLEPDPARLRGVLWRRSVAYLIDAMILGVVTGFAFVVLHPLWPLFALIPLAYHSFLIGGPHSATLGQRLFDIEVRRLDGGRPSLLQAAIQTALFYATITFTSCLILLIAVFNRRRRTLHDVLAGTLTLRRADGPELLIPRASGARP